SYEDFTKKPSSKEGFLAFRALPS
ncbi:Hypothetical protein, partial CDS, partial [Neorhizobium galegae bv. orientalis]